jgi:hypothetical protein
MKKTLGSLYVLAVLLLGAPQFIAEQQSNWKKVRVFDSMVDTVK